MNSNRTAFFWDESCFWHAGGNYAQMAMVGGHVQPMVSGGLPEAPETKRRLKNLLDVTGLAKELVMRGAPACDQTDLLRVHPRSYLDEFKSLSDGGGGELGVRTPFGPGGFEIAALSAGLVTGAAESVLRGEYRNAYALSRPPGHHCLPDWPNGFCLMANIAIAIEAVLAKGLARKIAVVDWDVHHGNGTEAIFYDRADVLTISIHQERNYPFDTGDMEHTGKDEGIHANMNIPLPPGCGDKTYVETIEKLVLPKLSQFEPELVVVACGFDACTYDPLSRMMCTSETFRTMTRQIMSVTNGKLVAAHEGGYSELYVPFCGHAVLEQMSGSGTCAKDPMIDRAVQQQPNKRVNAFHSSLIDEMVDFFFT